MRDVETGVPSTGRPAVPMDSWSRLHPLSPVVRFGRALFVVVVVVVPRLATSPDPASSWVDIGVLAVTVVASVVYWLVTRWRVHGSELQIETGLVRRQSIRVPLSRIQAVDVVQPLVGRWLGLAEVRVEVAGRGSGRGRLAYLTHEHATEVRARLLALAHGLSEETPASPERRVLTMDNGRLVAATALGGPTVVAALLVVAGVVSAALNPAAFAALLGSFVPVLIVVGTIPARRVVAEFGLVVAEAGDGLRVRSGLLQTRAETIPYGRVQAVRWVQPPLWRPFGWCRLEVDVARQQSGRRGSEDRSAKVTCALLPAGSPGEAVWLLSRVLPEAQATPPPESRPPRRAAVKAPLSAWALRAWHDSRYIAARTGRLWLITVLVPMAKAQSFRYVQGPVQRRLGLATVHVDTAGRNWRAVARCRDAGEADTLLERLPELARAARRAPPPAADTSEVARD
ncbi:MAG: PH domain-containing protein [Streptosporangiaceae bacterium]